VQKPVKLYSFLQKFWVAVLKEDIQVSIRHRFRTVCGYLLDLVRAKPAIMETLSVLKELGQGEATTYW
jgi:hypothetical protein